MVSTNSEAERVFQWLSLAARTLLGGDGLSGLSRRDEDFICSGVFSGRRLSYVICTVAAASIIFKLMREVFPLLSESQSVPS